MNNSKDHGLLIYNRVKKTASGFIISVMLPQLHIRNRFNLTNLRESDKGMWVGMSDELIYLQNLYTSQWPYATSQHMKFINAVEHYGLSEKERPNWFNTVRSPIERLASLFYFEKTMDKPRQYQVRAHLEYINTVFVPF